MNTFFFGPYFFGRSSANTKYNYNNRNLYFCKIKSHPVAQVAPQNRVEGNGVRRTGR
jgi:hypothetical protein